MPPLNVLLKPSSSLCNLSCDYCFYSDEAKKRNRESYGLMTEQTLKNVIRKTLLKAEGQISYAFQGGEPTLCGLDFFKRVIEFQQKYNKNNITIQNALQTNGYLLDEDWCRFFAEHKFLIGLSVDGIPEIHNSLRHERGTGRNTFERISMAADLMDRFQVEYNILTVVTSEIVERVDEIYAYYKSRNWNYQQYIACLDPLDEDHGRNEYALTPEAYGRFLTRLFELWYQDYLQGKQPYIRQFENYVAIAAGYMPESCDQRGHCSIQNVVEADGGVYPCDFYVLDEYLLGNFNVDQLEDIDSKRKDIEFLERSKLLSKDCASCRFYELCRGGCQRYRDFNSMTGLYDNYFCPSFQRFFDRWKDTIVEIGRSLQH